MPTLSWNGNCLTLLNQTLLPTQIEYLTCDDYPAVAQAIAELKVRGAPAIGIAAAFAIVLGARKLIATVSTREEFYCRLDYIAEQLRQTRPTAINLSWAIDRMLTTANREPASCSLGQIVTRLEREAIAIAAEDKEVNRKISANGASLFTAPLSVLTHCNAGALATSAYGTALGIIRQSWQDGKIIRVYADETRPLLQGARLTTWELQQENIPVTLITDSMAGWVMKKRLVQAVIVGADRIALNGDVANKIGTYSLAVLARMHNLPFYVAAPLSTFDFSVSSGDDIPIEERRETEITSLAGVQIAPTGISVFNPAFDVTPAALITAIITEKGILKPPYGEAIAKLSKER